MTAETLSLNIGTQPQQAEETLQSQLNRREFMTYAWGAAVGLLTLETLGASYFFLAPRFRAGEFGGKFAVGTAEALPATAADPQPVANGKFWLVNTAAGPKALYMVCTHLGCLYKWDKDQQHFHCPCHGSTFNREGYQICGPAPRSLDQFVIEVVESGEVKANTTQTDNGVQPPAIISATAELVVNTGHRIPGQPKVLSPALDQGKCSQG